MNRRIFTGVAVTAMMAFLVGCDEIKFGGTLNVFEAMTFAQDAGKVVVNPGQFQTKVILGMNGNQKQIKLEIKNNGNQPTVVDLNFDKNIETNDQFTLKADQIKQAFDVTGNIVTTVTRTQEQWGNQSCTYQAQEIVCRGTKSADEVKDANPELTAKVEESILDFGKQYPGQYGQYPYPGQYGNPPVPNCHPVWVTRYGWQDIRYYDETTKKDITAAFVQADKNLANYVGTGSSTQRINTYQGYCR